jgi:4-hydroxy-tetrahydrodipicolinate synthase
MGIKEASGNISYAAMVAQYLSDDFRMYSGNDDIVIPILSLGGSGVISVWADVQPREVHEMVRNYLDGNTAAALKTQIDSLELIHALFAEVNPIPVKAALARMGLIGEYYRQPLWPMADGTRARLHAALEGAGLLG